PVLKARAGVELPGAHRAGLRVPGDDGLGAGAARRGADAEDVAHRLLAMPRGQRRDELGAAREHLGGELDQRSDADVAVARSVYPVAGLELQRAHAAPADVAEPLDRVEVLRAAPLTGQPRVDQRPPVAVG